MFPTRRKIPWNHAHFRPLFRTDDEAKVWAKYFTRASKMRIDWLMMNYEPLSIQCANAVAPHFNNRQTISKEEIGQAGREGLYQAIRAFDPNFRVTFISYAQHKIKSRVKDRMRELDSMSRKDRAFMRRHEAAESTFYAIHGRKPTEVEFAEAMNQPPIKMKKMLMRTAAATPVAFTDYESDCSVERHGPSYDAAVSKRRTRADDVRDREDIEPLLMMVSPERRPMFKMLYVNNNTMAEVGYAFNLHESGVCTIVKQELEILRSKLAPPKVSKKKVRAI